MTLPLPSSLERGMIAGLFVNFQIVINFFDPWDPFNATKKTRDFIFKYWSTDRYVSALGHHFDSAWIAGRKSDASRSVDIYMLCLDHRTQNKRAYVRRYVCCSSIN
jgi:hypothetical protein